MYVSGTFHDSYIREIKTVLGRPYEPEFKSKLQVSFEMYGNCFDIMLEFYGGVDIKFGIAKYLNDVYLSSIVFHNGLICWLDGDDELRPIDIPDFDYIRSKWLRWKIIPKLDE